MFFKFFFKTSISSQSKIFGAQIANLVSNERATITANAVASGRNKLIFNIQNHAAAVYE